MTRPDPAAPTAGRTSPPWTAPETSIDLTARQALVQRIAADLASRGIDPATSDWPREIRFALERARDQRNLLFDLLLNPMSARQEAQRDQIRQAMGRKVYEALTTSPGK